MDVFVVSRIIKEEVVDICGVFKNPKNALNFILEWYNKNAEDVKLSNNSIKIEEAEKQKIEASKWWTEERLNNMTLDCFGPDFRVFKTELFE